MTDLARKHCKPCKGGTPPKTDSEISEALAELAGWAFVNEALERTFEFKNYFRTTAFVNAVVWIAHQEDHHPDITFGYKTCAVRYATHSIGGISDNDFICAAKINRLVEV